MNHWRSLKEFLEKKGNAPLLEPTFWFYLIGAVILAGGCGIWVALADEFRSNVCWNWKPVNAALYTYFPALAAGSAFDILLFHQERFVRALAFLSVILIGCLVAIATTLASCVVGCIVSCVGCIIALGLWWLANADNLNLREGPAPLTATGEDRPREMAGTLDGLGG